MLEMAIDPLIDKVILHAGGLTNEPVQQGKKELKRMILVFVMGGAAFEFIMSDRVVD